MNNWMTTYLAKHVNVLKPELEDIDIRDIAHHLALINRFNGATHRPYSVAQHSIHVAQRLPPNLQLWGLLHDAAEAYVGDMISPLRRLDEMGAFNNVIRQVERTVFIRFGLLQIDESYLGLPTEVHAVDKRVGWTEVRDLLRDSGKGWENPLPPYADFRITPWNWELAEQKYLSAYEGMYELKYDSNK